MLNTAFLFSVDRKHTALLRDDANDIFERVPRHYSREVLGHHGIVVRFLPEVPPSECIAYCQGPAFAVESRKVASHTAEKINGIPLAKE